MIHTMKSSVNRSTVKTANLSHQSADSQLYQGLTAFPMAQYAKFVITGAEVTVVAVTDDITHTHTERERERERSE